jgi:hypothetical protein
MSVIYHKIKHRYRYKANLKGWNQVYLFILLLDPDPDWFILFPDKVSAESMWNPDTLLYLSIMNFLFRREVRERAKPSRLPILLNFKT